MLAEAVLLAKAERKTALESLNAVLVKARTKCEMEHRLQAKVLEQSEPCMICEQPIMIAGTCECGVAMCSSCCAGYQSGDEVDHDDHG